jgi:hypothetical protein
MGCLIADRGCVQRVSVCVLRCNQSVPTRRDISTHAGFTSQYDACHTRFGAVRSDGNKRPFDSRHEDQLKQIGKIIFCELATKSDAASLTGATRSKEVRQ